MEVSQKDKQELEAIKSGSIVGFPLGIAWFLALTALSKPLTNMIEEENYFFILGLDFLLSTLFILLLVVLVVVAMRLTTAKNVNKPFSAAMYTYISTDLALTALIYVTSGNLSFFYLSPLHFVATMLTATIYYFATKN